MSRDYLHGYSKQEQQRLIDQARFLEPWLYDGVDFSRSKKLLEVGCGVGAQTEILLKRFPHLEIHAVDVSPEQVSLARERLSEFIDSGQLKVSQADAMDLSSINDSGFDSAYLCWFLEHVYQPLDVLNSVRQFVDAGAQLIVSEVNNSSLFVHPYSANILEYWFQLNDYQWSIQGHPFIGLQMGNLLRKAGFSQIVTEPKSFFFDSRNSSERNAFLQYFFGIFNSANEILVKKGRVHHEMIDRVRDDFETAKLSDDSVFYYSYVRASATT